MAEINTGLALTVSADAGDVNIPLRTHHGGGETSQYTLRACQCERYNTTENYK